MADFFFWINWRVRHFLNPPLYASKYVTNTTHKVGGVDYFFLSGKKTLNCPFTSAVPSGKYAVELHRNTV